MSETSTKPHSECVTCGDQFATPQQAAEHREATAKTCDSEFGPNTSSHTTRVVQPTPEEQKLQAVRFAIDSALDEACMSLEDDIDRGVFTEDELKYALRHYTDLWTAWNEFRR